MGKRKLKRLLRLKLASKIPDNLLDLLPSSYQIIGDIMIIQLRDELLPFKHDIGESILELFPNIRTVCRKVRGISGEMRLPSIEVIAGDKNTETIHYENGVYYKLDVAQVMFAKGNKKERMRIARLVKDGEIVIDMFAGIGYFTIPIAVHANPEIIYAIDINPVAIKYLKENLKLNNVESKVKVILGDNRTVIPNLGNIADRIIMGYLPDTWKFLYAALKGIKLSGGIIHYHDIAKENELDMLIKKVREIIINEGFDVRIIYNGVVKKFAPRINHYVFDIAVKKK